MAGVTGQRGGRRLAIGVAARIALVALLVSGTHLLPMAGGASPAPTAAAPSPTSGGVGPSPNKIVDPVTPNGQGETDRRQVLVEDDLASASLAARRQSRRVEVSGMRDSNRTVYANKDGSVTVEHSPVARRVRRGGEWVDIDLALRDRSGAVVPAAGPHDLVVGNGADQRLASLTSPNGATSVTMRWGDGDLPAPTLAGNRARFAVSPQTSVEVVATSGGFEQLTVLTRRPKEAVQFRLPLQLRALSLEERPDGSLVLIDRHNEPVFEVAAPLMWDAAHAPEDGGEPSGLRPVAMSVERAQGGVDLVLTPDWSFLSDPATVYPVTIDPTVSSVAKEVDTWVATNTAAANGSSAFLYTGKSWQDGATYRAFMKFQPLWDGLNSGYTIQSATLALFNFSTGSCTPAVVSAHRVTDKWPATHLVWPGPPYALWDGYSGQGTFAYGNSGCPANWGSLDVTAMVAGWIGGAIPNHGMVIRVNESVTSEFRKFCSFESNVSPCTPPAAPYLSVTYAPPTAPTIASSGGLVNGGWRAETPASNQFTWSGGSDIEGWWYSLDGGAWQWTTTPAVWWNPPGAHSIDVIAQNTRGDLSGTAWFDFGSGTPSIVAGLPAPGTRSTSTFAVQAVGGGNATSAYLQRSIAAANNFANPTGRVELAASGATWDGAVTNDGSTAATPLLLWHAEQETALPRVSLVELRVCFTYPGFPDQCTPVREVQKVPHAFGGNFPTEDAGPGQVALFTGEYALTETDVTVPGYTGALSLGRSHTTYAGPTATPAGVFGRGWTADLRGPDSGDADMYVLDLTEQDGTMVLLSGSGQFAAYRQPSGGHIPRELGDYAGLGDSASDGSKLRLDYEASLSTHRLSLTNDAGTVTTWTSRPGEEWRVESVQEAGQAAKTTYSYDASGRVSRILAPVPTGVTCGAAADAPGCRSLAITYSPTSQAPPSGGAFGAYPGLVERVDLVIFDPAKPGGAGMVSVPVARYVYDSTGLLRQAWDPRLDKPDGSHLVTAYAYETVGAIVRLTSLTPPGQQPVTFGFDAPTDQGRLSTVSRYDPALAATATTTLVYGVPATGSGLPDLSPGTAARWGQTVTPSGGWATGTAVFPPSHRPPTTSATAMPAADWAYASISYTDGSGNTLNTAGYGADDWQLDARQYDANNNLVFTLSPANRARADAANSPALAEQLATRHRLGSTGLILDTWGPSRQVVLDDGTTLRARLHTANTYDTTRPSELLLRSDVGVTDPDRTWVTDRDITTTIYGYDKIVATDPAEGDGWTLRLPTTRTIAHGTTAATTTITRYDTDGRVIETRQPASSGGDAGTTVTVYWAAAATNPRAGEGSNPDGATCAGKPEWAGLPCRTGPAAPPPGTTLPVAYTTSYDYLLAPTAVREVSGTGTDQTVRTSSTGYDRAGRPVTSALSVIGMPATTPTDPIPDRTYGYNPDTALPTTVTAAGLTITTGHDTWGRTTSYTDADGVTATTSYTLDGQVKTRNDGKGTYTYTYDGPDANGRTERRGLLTALDTGMGSNPDVLTAAYDSDGLPTLETYPNGLRAARTLDEVGELAALSYAKDGTTWLSWTRTSSASGQTREMAGPHGSRQVYVYDKAGRLASTVDTAPNGSGCQSRAYGFDLNSNRTHLERRDGTPCPPVPDIGSTDFTYDAADRATSPGYGHDPLGRVTAVPNSAVPGGADLTVRFYANDMVSQLTQGSEDRAFTLDPVGRLRAQTDSTSGAVTRTTLNHYADPGDSPAWWTQTKTSTTWFRNVQGISGTLVAEHRGSGVTLQLTNPHGDVIAYADNTTTAAGPTSYFEQNEYGIPRSTNTTFPKRYAWLGAELRSRDALAGLMLMGVRLYSPSSGRFLSPDPVPGGNANPYVYPTDPVNSFDLDGRVCMLGGVCQNLSKARGMQGVYEIVTKSGKRYVGRSENIYRRVHQHARSDAYRTDQIEKVLFREVRGGVVARRIAEQRLINARGLRNLLNQRNEISPKLWDVMGV